MQVQRLSGFEDVCAQLGFMDMDVAYTARAIYLNDPERMMGLIPSLVRYLPDHTCVKKPVLACIAFFGHLKGYVLEDYYDLLDDDRDALSVWNGPALMLSQWDDEVQREFDR